MTLILFVILLAILFGGGILYTALDAGMKILLIVLFVAIAIWVVDYIKGRKL